MSFTTIAHNMCIQTYTGEAFDLFRPRPEMIHLEDIAHALSQLVRFTGHAKYRYSIAEHCIHVASLVPPEYKLEALLHDATEAYINDLSSPLKHGANMQGYRGIEKHLEYVIATTFQLSPDAHMVVKQADRIMLAVEAKALLSKPLIPEWNSLLLQAGELPDVKLSYWSAKQAKARFLKAVSSSRRY